MSTIGREILEGIYLSALVPLVRERILDRPCTRLGMTSLHTLSLQFSGGWLSLNASPGDPGLWWSEAPLKVIAPQSPSWEHHLSGAVVAEVLQQGTDRVLELRFRERTPYDAGGVRLIFEMTGRNANLILCRNGDMRILACTRRVLSRINRYRTVSPGARYAKPPPSGHPVEEWESGSLLEELEKGSGSREICRLLEGVGPAAAAAIMEHPRGISFAVTHLARRIINGDFQPWETSRGFLPVQFGKGREVGDPLAPPLSKGEERERNEYSPAAADLEKLLRRKRKALVKRMRSAELSLEKLDSPDDLRNMGNLVLTWKKDIRKGMEQAVLTGWNGEEVRIPLKPALSPAENASRFFRRAGSIHLERERLEKHVLQCGEELLKLDGILAGLKDMEETRAGEILSELRRPPRDTGSDFLEFILPGGWRCLAGRNAVQNDRLTFRTAARDDIWLHARGVAGAHVVIRRDGRADNPSAAAIQEAARIAAENASSNGIVPVDWTLVKYVRRQKGGGPGQVVYSREKTVFAQA